MRVLIDGGVFAAPSDEPAVEFWSGLLPRLAERLRPGPVYLLNRAPRPAFPDGEVLQNLFAPPVDFRLSALEDRRLRALCRELDVEAFVSTYHTSAGIDTPSLFLIPIRVAAPGRRSALEASRRRAAGMASLLLALSEADIAECGARHGLPTSAFRLVSVSAPAGEGLAQACADALADLARRRHVPEGEHAARRGAAEEAAAAEASRLKRTAERRATWRHTLARIARALGQPQRFPAHFARLAGRLR